MAKFFAASSKSGKEEYLINADQITSIRRSEGGCIVRFGEERTVEINMAGEQVQKQIGLN